MHVNEYYQFVDFIQASPHTTPFYIHRSDFFPVNYLNKITNDMSAQTSFCFYLTVYTFISLKYIMSIFCLVFYYKANIRIKLLQKYSNFDLIVF